jgi:serine/threonine-protein kinase
MQTADGLAAAHAQGLVHRDVKPANILLEDAVERVRLTDFGLARAAAEAAVTRSGVVAGTPHYMAPEQALGKAADQRADLFSLGSTLYAMCAGHPPFRADSPLAVLKRVCDEEPRPLLEVNADVPKWLAAIVAKLMHKDPAQRFQTAEAVSDLLQRCLAHVQQPTAVPMPIDPVFAEPRPSRRRVNRNAALAAVAALVLAASALLWSNLDKGRTNQEEPTNSASGLPGRQIDWSLGVDDVATQILSAQKLAADLEGKLIHETGEHDSLADSIRLLRERAKALEREVAPSLSITNERPAYLSSPIPTERK